LLCQQFGEKGVLRGAIRLRIVRLAEGDYELPLPGITAAAAAEEQRSGQAQ
jgi:hypothetical protein